MAQEQSPNIPSIIPKKEMEKIAILKANKQMILVNSFLSFSLSLMGSIGLIAELALLKLPIGNIFVFLALLFFFPSTVLLISIFRNRILKSIFYRFSTYTYLRLAKFWRYYIFIVLTASSISLILSKVFSDNPFIVILPLLVFGFLAPFYFIFEFSITYKGEIRILFANLLLYLGHFKKRNIFWQQIAEKIRDLLRTGWINVSKDELMYHFNLRLWETNDDITLQLRSIEKWLLGEQKSCCESIKQIIPQTCFQPLKKTNFLNSQSGQIDVNKVLDVIKVIGAIISSVIVVILAYYFHIIPT